MNSHAIQLHSIAQKAIQDAFHQFGCVMAKMSVQMVVMRALVSVVSF